MASKSKNKKSNYSKMSETKLLKANAKNKAAISKSNSRIDKINDQIAAYMKQKAEKDDFFDGKNSGYKKLTDQSSDIDAKIQKLQDSKTKSAAVKKDNAKKIADYNQQKAKLSAQMSKIRDSSSYTGAKNAYSRIESNIKNANKALKANKDIRKTQRAEYKKSNSEVKKRQAKKLKAERGQNSKKIADKINKIPREYTYLYPADMSTDKIIALAEYDPSETGDVNLPTQPIDTKMPTANYATANSRTMSGTYRLVIGDIYKSIADLNKTYVDIIHYANNGTEMKLNGFSKWNHAFITSYGKQADATSNKNQLVLSLSFTFAKLSKIQTAKTKKGKKRGKKSKVSGLASKNNPNRERTVSSKGSLVSISKKSGIDVKDLKFMNPKASVGSSNKSRIRVS